jgi:transcriptional regulator with XRE-family HTH domain
MTTRTPSPQPLKAIIALRGATNAAIARDLGVTAQYLGQCANGRERPSPEFTERLAQFLDVDPDALFLDEPGDAIVIEFVRRTRAASGVPERLDDPAVAAAIALALRSS